MFCPEFTVQSNRKSGPVSMSVGGKVRAFKKMYLTFIPYYNIILSSENIDIIM